MKRISKQLAAAAALFFWSIFASAAVIWDQSPDTTGGSLSSPKSNIQSGQNFTDEVLFLSNQSVGGIDIYTVPAGPFGGASLGELVRIRIWTGAPNGSLQEFVESISVIDTVGSASYPPAVRAHVDFTNAVTMLAGVPYWVGMSGESVDLGQYGIFNGSGPLLDNQISLYTGTAYLGQTGAAGDMAFRLEGGVPEPASLALLALGLAGLGISRRKTRKS